jgi:RND family efflux transporter MFP subunit
MRIPRVLGLLVACACAKGAQTADGEKPLGSADSGAEGAPATLVSLPVTAEEVIDGDLVLSVMTKGFVRSETETRLKSEVGGTVEEILARPGDRVQKGQPIIRLAQYEFDLAIRRAEAAVSEATVRYEDNIVPESVTTRLPPTPERRRNAEVRAGLLSARISLEQARYEKERSTLRAPFDGVIDRVDVSLGERIGAGQAVTVLVDVTNLRVDAEVLDHDIPLVKAGGEAYVSTAASPRPTRGRIIAVLPIVDTTARAGRAYVRVQGNPTLRPGMYADVRLEAQRLTKRRLVPTAAIINRDGRDLVFVIRDGRAQWTYMVSGRSNGVYTEVLPDTAGQNPGQIPVKPGELVIVQGQLTLTHDAPVTVVAKRETDPAKD